MRVFDFLLPPKKKEDIGRVLFSVQQQSRNRTPDSGPQQVTLVTLPLQLTVVTSKELQTPDLEEIVCPFYGRIPGYNSMSVSRDMSIPADMRRPRSWLCSKVFCYTCIYYTWSPGLVALHLTPPFVTLSTGYPFPSEFSSKYSP